MRPGEHWSGRQVLVTGGLGFIGSNLAIRLVELGARVLLLDSLDGHFGGNWANIAPVRDRVTVHLTDMRDASTLEALVKDQDDIFHLAGQVSHRHSMEDPLFDWSANGLPTLNLVEACRQVRPTVRILFTSTRQVYGVAAGLPVDETHPTVPQDINGVHKLAAEHYLRIYGRIYGIGTTILRLTNTYGPRQRISESGLGCAGYFVYQALQGGVISLYGGGAQRRDFNFVDDVVDAMLRALATDACQGETYNLGGDTTCSLREYAEILQELCGVSIESVPFPSAARSIDIGDYQGDYSRFHEVTGWRPTVDLRQGLHRTLEFYRAHARAYGLCPPPN